MTRLRSLKRWGLAVALGLGLGAAAVWTAGSLAVAPAPADVGDPPPDLPANDVTVSTGARGWWTAPDSARGALVLVHGIRAHRRAHTGRAREARRRGYASLLLDLQGHGESPGEQITFGVRESRDVQAAVAWIRAHHPGLPVGVIGLSLGGAAAVLAEPGLDVDAIVIEGVYADLGEALKVRLRDRAGPLGGLVAPLLLAQVGPRLGVPAEAVRPVEGIARTRAPVLVLTGADDWRASPADARALYAAAPNPAGLWIVAGAGHQDLFRYAPEAYARRVFGFLDRAFETARTAVSFTPEPRIPVATETPAD